MFTLAHVAVELLDENISKTAEDGMPPSILFGKADNFSPIVMQVTAEAVIDHYKELLQALANA